MRINAIPLTLTRTPGGLGNTNIENFSAANYTWIGVGLAAQDFEVAEVLVWARALTPAEIDQVEAYLSARYGIPI
jgi:hypothetical protein